MAKHSTSTSGRDTSPHQGLWSFSPPQSSGEDRQQAKRPTPDIGIIFAGAIMGAAILAVSIFTLLPISAFYKESNSLNWLVTALGGVFGAVATFVNVRARKSVS